MWTSELRDPHGDWIPSPDVRSIFKAAQKLNMNPVSGEARVNKGIPKNHALKEEIDPVADYEIFTPRSVSPRVNDSDTPITYVCQKRHKTQVAPGAYLQCRKCATDRQKRCRGQAQTH
jgi:hypothetical protein